MTEKNLKLSAAEWMAIIFIILMMIGGLTLNKLATKDRDHISPQEKCFKEYAIKFCNENNLNFTYIPQYFDDRKIETFACKTFGDERNGTEGTIKMYYFTSQEREECLK